MKSGNREIIGSGSIVTHNGDSRVEIEQSGLGFSIIFESGPDAPAVAATGGGERLELTFKNFDNPLGISWSSDVGLVADQKLILSVYIQTLGTARCASAAGILS